MLIDVVVSRSRFAKFIAILYLIAASIPANYAFSSGFLAVDPRSPIPRNSLASRPQQVTDSWPGRDLPKRPSLSRKGDAGPTVRMLLDPVVAKMAFGAIAGGVSSVMLLPVDMAKTAVQLRASAAGAKEPVAENTNIISVVGQHLSDIIAKDGVSGLFRGFVPALVGGAPESAIQFVAHDYAMAILTTMCATAVSMQGAADADMYTLAEAVTRAVDCAFAGGSGLTDACSHVQGAAVREISDALSKVDPMVLHGLAGAVAGFLTIIVTNPLEVLKQRAILDEGSGNVVHELQSLGFKGLYKGYAATWLRDVPFLSIYFSACAKLHVMIQSGMGDGPLTATVATMGAGFLAGMLASFIVTPADVIKTRIQCGNYKDSSISAVGKSIYEDEGLNGLFRGLAVRVGRAAPAMMINIVVYETLKSFLSFL